MGFGAQRCPVSFPDTRVTAPSFPSAVSHSQKPSQFQETAPCSRNKDPSLCVGSQLQIVFQVLQQLFLRSVAVPLQASRTCLLMTI